jgi:hypothetical protein
VSAELGTSEEEAAFVATSKRETARAQPNFPCLRDRMDGHRTWGKDHESMGERSAKHRVALALRDGEQARLEKANESEIIVY